VILASDNLYPVLGLVAATVASMFWAVSVVLYRRVGRILPPVRLNMTKGLLASVILGGIVATQLALGVRPWELPADMLALMALSGVIGIAIGDTLFFAGLNRMGARRALLLFMVNPVITALVAWAFLDENLSPVQIVGIAMTCGGVAWVIAERNTKQSDGHVDPLGVIYCLSAACCQATGVLISRYVFKQGEMTPASSAALRLTAATLVLMMLIPLDKVFRHSGGEDHHHPRLPSKKQAGLMFLGGLMLGTVGGIWLMQTAVKYTNEVGVASTLLSTSPLFVLPVVAILGEHISRRAILGALVTIAGIEWLFLHEALQEVVFDLWGLARSAV